MMGQVFHQFKDLHLDAQFFGQLAPQTLFEALTRFAFAAGKFPQAAQVRAGRTLGDEQLAAAKNQAR